MQISYDYKISGFQVVKYYVSDVLMIFHILTRQKPSI